MKETTHHGNFCTQSSQQHIVTALCAEKYETEKINMITEAM